MNTIINRLRTANRYYPSFVWVVSIAFFVTCLSVFFYLFSVAFEDSVAEVFDVIFSEKIRNVLLKSLFLALGVAVASAMIGLVFSLLIERTNLWFKNIWNVLIILSMAMPSYVLAFAWVDRNKGFASFWGAFLILLLVTVPFSYLNIRGAVRRLNIQLEEIASSLGSSRLNTLVKIVLPQIKKSIMTAVVISVLYVITDFGAVSTLRVEVFTWVIYNAYRAGFSPERAAILSCVLFVVAMLLVIAEGQVSKNKEMSRNQGNIKGTKKIGLGKFNFLAQLIFGLYISMALVFPIAQSVSWSFQYRSGIEVDVIVAALRNTVMLAVVTTFLTTFIALCLSLLATRSQLGKYILKFVMAMHSIPGIVTAIAFVFIGTRVLPSIYLEWYLVVIALCVTFSYLAVGPLQGILERNSQVHLDAAFSLGRGKYFTFFQVTLPLCLSGLKASAILVFIAVIKELPITLILRPNEQNTLATELWSNLGVSKYGVVAPSMLLLIGLSMIPLLFLMKEKYG